MTGYLLALPSQYPERVQRSDVTQQKDGAEVKRRAAAEYDLTLIKLPFGASGSPRAGVVSCVSVSTLICQFPPAFVSTVGHAAWREYLLDDAQPAGEYNPSE